MEASDVRFTVRDTTSGRYQSITVHAPVKNATMLYKCYELIDEVGVLMLMSMNPLRRVPRGGMYPRCVSFTFSLERCFPTC